MDRKKNNNILVYFTLMCMWKIFIEPKIYWPLFIIMFVVKFGSVFITYVSVATNVIQMWDSLNLNCSQLIVFLESCGLFTLVLNYIFFLNVLHRLSISSILICKWNITHFFFGVLVSNWIFFSENKTNFTITFANNR